MHPFFAPLSEREVALLLTTLTVGGSDQVGIFQHLPPQTRGRLQEKATALLNISSDKRVPLMVRELKSLLAFNGLRGVERLDPSWIVQGLKGESARVIATVLINLPTPMVRSVLKRLPTAVRKELPPKDEIRQIPDEVILGVRQIFETRFDAMPIPSAGPFTFKDTLHLERIEIFDLMRDLGLVELGQAFVSVGKLALVELCRRLPRDKAEELILAVRSASTVDLPDRKSAQRFLSRVVVNFEDTEEFFQKAGLWRLAKASLLEDNEFRAAFRQRIPRKAGQLFTTYLEKAGEMQELTPEVLQRLQDSVLVRIRQLSKRGAIGSRWQQVEMAFHDPASAELAANAPPASLEGDPSLAGPGSDGPPEKESPA